MRNRIDNILKGNSYELCANVLAHALYDLFGSVPNPEEQINKMIHMIHAHRKRVKSTSDDMPKPEGSEPA